MRTFDPGDPIAVAAIVGEGNVLQLPAKVALVEVFASGAGETDCTPVDHRSWVAATAAGKMHCGPGD
jgi:hypothetical protein